MIKNYIKIAWRNIQRHRFFSIVNIIGLFTGILFTLLIGTYIWGELQVNKKLRHHERQYILTTVSKDPNVGYELATFGPLAKRLKEDYPHLVANYYRYDGITSVVSKADKNFREGLQVGDSNLLKMYGFEALHGNTKTALNDPYSVVITADKAIKYFGKTDVLGESITIQSFSGGKRDFNITAVLKEIPQNTITELAKGYKNSFFIPMNTLSFFGRQDVDAWGNMFIASYVELKKGVTARDIEKPINQLIQQNANPALQKVINVKPVLLSDYHLQQDNGLVKRMLYTLSFTGLFILLMAIVNFINIAISSSSARMKEIGIRKVLGGIRKQLILQFLTESLVLVCIATLAAIAAYPLLKPLFEQIVGKQVPELSSFPFYFVLVPVGIVFIVGLLAGLYPAFVLSSLKSVDSLKGKLKTVKQNFLLRKSLVGFQFAIAIIVLVAAAVVAKQVAHFFGQGLGYNKEYIVSSQVPRDWTIDGVKKMATVRNEFAAMPQVSNVALSYEIPDGANAGQVPVYKSGSDSTTATFMQLLQTDENYLSTYEVPLNAGNFFDSRGLDSGKVVINEKALAALGWKNADEAIGRQLRIPGDPTVFAIKGVSKDFHFGSMQKAIPPILFFNVRYSPFYRYLSFKLKPGNISATIESIQKKWSQLLPGSSFEYTFMDDTLKKLYASELQLKKAAYTSTALALIIVLLGILGLVSLSIQKRTKEIGIRKVLGASVQSIISLFMKEFVWVMIVAGFIACPLAWLIMQGWLNDYAYRISLTAMPFIISMAGLATVTIMLIALQTVKAGLENPVKSLGTE
jgi:putative ABC transport system permease protein